MMKLDDFREYQVFNFKNLTGGKSFNWRDGSTYAYSGSTSAHDEENVTSYDSYAEAHNDGCSSLSCIDQAYDCGDGQLLF